MNTSSVEVINADAIKAWVQQYLAPLCPEGSHISVIPRSWHCKGESAFFAAVDVDETVTLTQLRTLEVTEHTRAHYLCFYVDDVIAAAVQEGHLAGDFYHVHYQW